MKMLTVIQGRDYFVEVFDQSVFVDGVGGEEELFVRGWLLRLTWRARGFVRWSVVEDHARYHLSPRLQKPEMALWKKIRAFEVFKNQKI